MATQKERNAKRIEALATLLQIGPANIPAGKHLIDVVRARLFGIGVRDTCGRCGGSGHYSFNQRDGTRCFGCSGHQEHAADPTKPTTYERAEAAVKAGALAAYFAHRDAKAAAKRAIKPLMVEIEALCTAVHVEADRAFGKYGTHNDSAAVVRSFSHRLRAQANHQCFDRAGDVKFAAEQGNVDPDAGILFAVEILRGCAAELRAMLDNARGMSPDALRAQHHPDFACSFCGTTLSVFANMERGAKVICFYPWVRDDAPGKGCHCTNAVP
jgi:hypothetical protein